MLIHLTKYLYCHYRNFSDCIQLTLSIHVGLNICRTIHLFLLKESHSFWDTHLKWNDLTSKLQSFKLCSPLGFLFITFPDQKQSPWVKCPLLRLVCRGLRSANQIHWTWVWNVPVTSVIATKLKSQHHLNHRLLCVRLSPISFIKGSTSGPQRNWGHRITALAMHLPLLEQFAGWRSLLQYAIFRIYFSHEDIDFSVMSFSPPKPESFQCIDQTLSIVFHCTVEHKDEPEDWEIIHKAFCLNNTQFKMPHKYVGTVY